MGTDSIHDTAKAADIVDTVTDTAKAADAIDNVTDVAKAADTVEDIADVGKDISKLPLEELPEKVQETFKAYAECGWDGEKALANLADGTSAGKTFGNYEEILPTVDKAGNPLSYKEFDAFSLGDDPRFPTQRGLSRFVKDNLGNIYFTGQ